MPKIIQLPSQEELPPGPRRRFAETLYRLWSQAGRPAAVKVSERIQELDMKGSASKETVRRMLSGKVIPQEWENAEAVFIALSQMAGRDPDRLVTVESETEYGEIGFGPEPARAVFHQFWREADDRAEFAHEPMEDYTPPAPKSPPPADDPWATGKGGFGGPPPF